MTIKNTIPNEKIAAAAKAVIGVDVATATLAQRAASLLALGVTPDRIEGKGDLWGQFQEVTASAILTQKERALYNTQGLALHTSVKDANGKITKQNTPYGAVVKRVNAAIARIRKEIAKEMAAPSERGASERKTPTQTFFKVVDGYVSRFSKADASDTFDFDPITAKAALVKLLKDLS